MSTGLVLMTVTSPPMLDLHLSHSAGELGSGIRQGGLTCGQPWLSPQQSPAACGPPGWWALHRPARWRQGPISSSSSAGRPPAWLASSAGASPRQCLPPAGRIHRLSTEEGRRCAVYVMLMRNHCMGPIALSYLRTNQWATPDWSGGCASRDSPAVFIFYLCCTAS